MDNAQLTAQQARAAVTYDPATGVFRWAARFGKRGIPGAVAGTTDWNGYRVVTINGKRHKAHRLAFLVVNGDWPPEAVDHINGDRADNRWSNLRPASPAENQQNRRLQRNNKSGLVGVSWNSRAAKWRAGIRVNGRSLNLGNFDDKHQAHKAHIAAKASLHPFQPTPRECSRA